MELPTKDDGKCVFTPPKAILERETLQPQGRKGMKPFKPESAATHMEAPEPAGFGNQGRESAIIDSVDVVYSDIEGCANTPLDP